LPAEYKTLTERREQRFVNNKIALPSDSSYLLLPLILIKRIFFLYVAIQAKLALRKFWNWIFATGCQHTKSMYLSPYTESQTILPLRLSPVFHTETNIHVLQLNKYCGEEFVNIKACLHSPQISLHPEWACHRRRPNELLKTMFGALNFNPLRTKHNPVFLRPSPYRWRVSWKSYNLKIPLKNTCRLARSTRII